MSRTAALDQLQQVHELNRAFLGLLQSRVRQQRACLDLPPGVRARARRREPAACSTTSPCFPRTLFDLKFGIACAASARHGFRRSGTRALPLHLVGGAQHVPPQRVPSAAVVRARCGGHPTVVQPQPLSDLQQVACVPGHAAVRVPRAHVVLARTADGDAPRVAPAAHADGAAARHRARLAAAPPPASERLTRAVSRVARRGPYNSRPRSASGSYGHSWTR